MKDRWFIKSTLGEVEPLKHVEVQCLILASLAPLQFSGNHRDHSLSCGLAFFTVGESEPMAVLGDTLLLSFHKLITCPDCPTQGTQARTHAHRLLASHHTFI